MPATSNPVCSVISTKQVGLVTLTSVRQAPMTSRPTSRRPSAQSVGPTVVAPAAESTGYAYGGYGENAPATPAKAEAS